MLAIICSNLALQLPGKDSGGREIYTVDRWEGQDKGNRSKCHSHGAGVIKASDWKQVRLLLWFGSEMFPPKLLLIQKYSETKPLGYESCNVVCPF